MRTSLAAFALGVTLTTELFAQSTSLPLSSLSSQSAVLPAGGYNANYWMSSLAILTKPVQSGVTTDQNGNPSIFGNTNASDNFADELPGHSGTRAALRLAPFFNTDLTLQTTIKLPKEGHVIRFRAEAFNVFNSVNFYNPSLSLLAPLTFGEFQQTTPPREMQFALRYEF